VPGLTNIDPQGELVRRIAALEAEQRRIGTLRRQPSPGCKMRTSAGESFTSGVNLVDLALPSGESYDTAGMADPDTHLVTLPSDGVYQVVIYVPRMSGTAQDAFVLAGVNGMTGGNDSYHYFSAGGQSSHTFSKTGPYVGGSTLGLYLYLPTAGADSLGSDYFSMTVERLHDIPDQS
jgi:hypothetical protein